MIKNLACLFFAFLFAHSVVADDLCDASCELTITFPDGGSLEAVEALTLTFGTSAELALGAAGTINTAVQPANTDYSSGASLVLAKGESITFGSGGYLVLGDGGNIDHLNMTISSSGYASLKAIGGAEAITIETLTLDGGLNITFEANNITINGTLAINTGSTINVIADTSTTGTSVCTVQDPSATISISSIPAIDTVDSCNTISDDLGLGGVLSVGSVDPNETILTGGSIIITPVTGIDLAPVVDAGDLTITLSDELLQSLPEGTELTVQDGNTCIITSGECISESGVRYKVVDGELVAASDDSGSLSLWSFVQAFVLLILGRSLYSPKHRLRADY